MSIYSGKPGTRRVRGLQRAQLRRVAALCQALTLYNSQLALKTPPVVFMNNQQAVNLSQALVSAQELIAQLNT